MNIWDQICDTLKSEVDQDKRFNELSSETKDLVKKMYLIEKQELEDDVLDEIGVECAEYAMLTLARLFGEKNLNQ